jgi:hypothetical protein
VAESTLPGMQKDRCSGPRRRGSQYTEPVWEPLISVVGRDLTGAFMWMEEIHLSDGSRLHAYKHRHTRRYLYLTTEGDAFQPMPCGRYVRERLDFAIQAALCTWSILNGWDADVADAVGEAVGRANRQVTEAT